MERIRGGEGAAQAVGLMFWALRGNTAVRLRRGRDSFMHHRFLEGNLADELCALRRMVGELAAIISMDDDPKDDEQ